MTTLPEFRHLPHLGSFYNKTRESVVNHRIALCAGLSVLGVALATAVQAQVYVEPPRGYVEPPQDMVHGGLPPSEILMAVRASGLRPLTQPARRGPQYVLLASDNMGGQLRVVVSAHNGRILNASPAYDPRFAYAPVRPRGLVPIAPPQHAAAPPPQYAAPPPDLKTPSPPPPRTARAAPAQQGPAAGASQNPGLASAPDAAPEAPARSARTPLPRPRPAVASNETATPAATPEAAPSTSAAAPEQPVSPPPAAPSKPAAETQMVPVAPLD